MANNSRRVAPGTPIHKNKISPKPSRVASGAEQTLETFHLLEVVTFTFHSFSKLNIKEVN